MPSYVTCDFNVVGIDVKKNVKHTQLISAKTGYGVEDLVTNLQSLWNIKGKKNSGYLEKDKC